MAARVKPSLDSRPGEHVTAMPAKLASLPAGVKGKSPHREAFTFAEQRHH